MAETPGKAFPTISEGTTVKVKLGILCSAVAALIGFVVWLTTIYNNQTLTNSRLERIEKDVGEIKDDLKRTRIVGLGAIP